MCVDGASSIVSFVQLRLYVVHRESRGWVKRDGDDGFFVLICNHHCSVLSVASFLALQHMSSDVMSSSVSYAPGSATAPIGEVRIVVAQASYFVAL